MLIPSLSSIICFILHPIYNYSRSLLTEGSCERALSLLQLNPPPFYLTSPQPPPVTRETDPDRESDFCYSLRSPSPHYENQIQKYGRFSIKNMELALVEEGNSDSHSGTRTLSGEPTQSRRLPC